MNTTRPIRSRATRSRAPLNLASPLRNGLIGAATLALAILPGVASHAVELKWPPQASHDVELQVTDSVISIRTTGNDPYLVWRVPQPVGAEDRILEFEYFCFDHIDSVSGYLGPPISEKSRFEMPDIAISQGWQSYRVDLVDAIGEPLPGNLSLIRIDPGVRADISLQLRHLQLRERTPREAELAAKAEERRRQKLADDQWIRDYLDASFNWSIQDVRVDHDQIHIAGKATTKQPEPQVLRLIEYPPHFAITDPGVDSGVPIPSKDGRFELTLPRYHEGSDRLQSGWRVQTVSDSGQKGFASARHFASTIAPRWEDLPAARAVPKSQKGLSAVSRRGPLEELPELGIHAITINLVLNRFLAERPGAGRERIDVKGPEVYFNPDPFRHYDDLIEFARQHDMVVTAIVLITQSKQTGQRSALIHPESDGGVYTMPDLSSERGARIYAFILDRIAQRYRHPERSPGAITNWIAHNEIDFHTTWTNMGPQPRRVLTETYYRSMRIIESAARQHNPHARVFVSLTHHWVVPDDGKWRQLSPKETIESLQQFSRMEGDFPWGVAYHPYPQSLFASLPWNDELAIQDFETPLITIQNLEMLGRFLELAAMRDSQGSMRPVLLSEQGFHSRSYEPADQARQAGSLWYAMRKIQRLPWVESFDYHRWIDHPNEGGLLLGLRTLPDDQHRYGRPKLAWEVYRAIGTADEQNVVRSLPQPIEHSGSKNRSRP